MAEPEKRDANRQRNRITTTTTHQAHQRRKERGILKKKGDGKRAHRFVRSKPKAVTMLFCGPFFHISENGADMQMNGIKRKSRAFQVLLNAHISTSRKKTTAESL